MKNVVLFGAGASYGSPHILPFSPPLSGGLFDNLAQHYPNTWGALPPDYSTEFKSNNLEQGMLKVTESAEHWIGPLMQTMTLFFTSFAPDRSRSDLYSQLLAQLRTENAISDTLFSTLNYECILELAASQLGLTVSYWDIVRSSGSISVWKLHGSCNFIPNPKQLSVRRVVSYRWGPKFNPSLIPVSPAEAAKWVKGDTALYPAMCIFALGKPSQISPRVFADYRCKWAELVEEAKNLVVVGVRPHSPDAHIWEPLAKSQAHLYFVGSEEKFRNWLPNRERRTSCFIGNTFDSAIGTLVHVLSN